MSDQYEVNPFIARRGYQVNLGDGVIAKAGDIVDEKDIDKSQVVTAYGRRVPLWTKYEAPLERGWSNDELRAMNKAELVTVAEAGGVDTSGKKQDILDRLLIAEEEEPAASEE